MPLWAYGAGQGAPPVRTRSTVWRLIRTLGLAVCSPAFGLRGTKHSLLMDLFLCVPREWKVKSPQVWSMHSKFLWRRLRKGVEIEIGYHRSLPSLREQ